MELKDTVELMLSDKFEDRLKAEYLQAVIRYRKLCNYYYKFVGAMPKTEADKLMYSQRKCMDKYIEVLASRLRVLGIELPEV